MKAIFQKAKSDLRDISQRYTNPGYPGVPPGTFPQQEKGYVSPVDQSDWFDSEDIQPEVIREPTPLDILRYRYHHGTNLGSVYVIERWLQPSRFPDGAEGSSELASVKAWVDAIGFDATRQKFEEQWAEALSEDDIEWLANEAKCTTIRLPIGYYNLPGREFTRGTPFEPYSFIYEGAWNSIRTLISRLRAHSIGVLIDLHALPGGANNQEHSGTNSGRAELWSSWKNRALGVQCCKFIAEDALTGSEIAGIQLANEAEWEAEGMYEWYDECIAAISAIDPSIPVIISDGWNLAKAIDYSLQMNSARTQRVTPVVVDTHYYWAFTDEDKNKSPQQIIGEVESKLNELDGKDGSVVDRGAAQVMVGEYSCVLTEDSWAKSDGVPKEELVRDFGRAQSRRYQDRAGGSYFWSYKMDWMPGGEWGFREQSNLGSIVPPRVAILSANDKYDLIEKAREERNGRLHYAYQQHVAYWGRVDPEGHYEHEKYEHGWKVGYEDAFTFFEGRATQGDRIGMLEIWVLRRVRESGYRGGFTWLFEQGLRKGIKDFYDAVEI
ncbi:glycoside hydrolase [Pyrenochaeta sp. DS3sAY3a]|nr:glycoside hydrolase [Pyrenochaeta sp. DS3sAY3a]